jgi:hypothetical protein
MFGTRQKPILAVSEPDLQGALAHLRALPHVPAKPLACDRIRLLDLVREALATRPKVGDVVEVAPGVLAQVKPLGVDLGGWDSNDGRLQVWLSVRGWGTDPSRLTEL